MSDAVIIWGEVLWDRFPDGDQLGGAPANLAWHLAQAGGWAQLVSRVGADADGARALERMAQLIDTDLVQIDPDRATGEVTVALEAGEPRYTLHAGRAWERIECTADVRTACEAAGVFVYGTLAQRTPEGLEQWRAASAAAKGLHVCDLNLRPNDRQLTTAIADGLAAADVVKINDRELAALRQWLGWTDPIAKLQARSELVVVTHGADGSTLHGDHGALEIPSVPAAPGGDNVGCGDSYLAILVYGLTCGWDLAASGRAAARWASAVAGERGATPVFDDDRIADLLEAS
ncbi:MAG: PfkB family carbohydrate kinase [Kofleriaceae bacterium]